jgi:hypothetical protein
MSCNFGCFYWASMCLVYASMQQHDLVSLCNVLRVGHAMLGITDIAELAS